MAIYTVVGKNGGREEDILFLREGFCWPAFFFGGLWALWHRQWLVAAAVFGLAATMAAAALPEAVDAILTLAVQLILGLEAQALRLRSLLASGYVERGLVAGRRLEEAELRYFASRMDAPAISPALPVERRYPPADTLGIFGNV
jgi:hypothetical protein